MKRIVFTIAAALAVTACAKKPETIAPSYISPTTYSSWSCSQLAAEATRVDSALSQASEAQNKARQNDTVGVIFLGLPVSSLSGGNMAEQIASLKGHKQVLEQTQIQKNCIQG